MQAGGGDAHVACGVYDGIGHAWVSPAICIKSELVWLTTEEEMNYCLFSGANRV